MPEELLKKGVVMFTDMKDYTAKSSLFTNKQIFDILDDQEVIISENVKKHGGKIIKSIGDAFIIFFEKTIDSINASLSIISGFEKYNSNKNIDLFKINIRIALDYGEVFEKKGQFGTDYFGDSVNLVSRLQKITSINGIYLTDNIINNLDSSNKYNYHFYKLGEKTFKGIFDNIIVYELLYKEKDIQLNKKGQYNDQTFAKKGDNNYYLNIDKKVNDLIFKISSIGAILATQPIPFIDSYNLLALEIYLLNEIAKIYGVKLNMQESKDIMIDIIKVLGLSYFMGQGFIGLTKVGLPVVGGYLVIPITFGAIYGFGKVINSYIYYISLGKKLHNREVKTLFKENISKGKEIGKEEKKKIIEIGKKNKNVFIKKISDLLKKYNLKEFFVKIKKIVFKK